MPRQCLFCENRVDSAEHIWSDWILKDLKPAEPIRRQIGRHTDVYTDDPEVLVRCVCQRCNNGWMSDFENENKPHISAMMHDHPITLEPLQQKSLTRWAILKAMILDAANRQRPRFYGEFERKSLKPPMLALPVSTLVWIGRFSNIGFHAGETAVWAAIDGIPKAMHGCVTNIVVGHLAIQVLTPHVPPMFCSRARDVEGRPGKWAQNLLDIWPVFGAVHWPPPLSFTRRGEDSIGALVYRWKVGQNVG